MQEVTIKGAVHPSQITEALDWVQHSISQINDNAGDLSLSVREICTKFSGRDEVASICVISIEDPLKPGSLLHLDGEICFKSGSILWGEKGYADIRLELRDVLAANYDSSVLCKLERLIRSEKAMPYGPPA